MNSGLRPAAVDHFQGLSALEMYVSISADRAIDRLVSAAIAGYEAILFDRQRK